jgi:hypothetical protein
MPDGLPIPLYLAMLDVQDKELRELKRAANKRARKK